MSLPVRFRPLARQELEEAIGWYERQQAGLGIEFKEAVDQMLTRIAETPGRFRPLRGEVRRALLRRFP
jgi:plasmid stabilization system protein ParE